MPGQLLKKGRRQYRWSGSLYFQTFIRICVIKRQMHFSALYGQVHSLFGKNSMVTINGIINRFWRKTQKHGVMRRR